MTQGPLRMTKADAAELSDLCDNLTRMVERRIDAATTHPMVAQEMRRVIGVQLIEAKYGIGNNNERLGDDPER